MILLSTGVTSSGHESVVNSMYHKTIRHGLARLFLTFVIVVVVVVLVVRSTERVGAPTKP